MCLDPMRETLGVDSIWHEMKCPMRVGAAVFPEVEDAEEQDNRDTVSECVLAWYVCMCMRCWVPWVYQWNWLHVA